MRHANLQTSTIHLHSRSFQAWMISRRVRVETWLPK